LYTEGSKNHLHHWTLIECSPEFETFYLRKNSIPEPGSCVEGDESVARWNDISPFCSRQSLVWAVGSSDVQQFPNDLAYPINGLKYIMLQLHFDNSKKIPSRNWFSLSRLILVTQLSYLLKDLREQSGLRLYATRKYRKTELGILYMVNGESWNTVVIPPHSDKFDINYMCHRNCTNVIVLLLN
jgi:hypothetical protein